MKKILSIILLLFCINLFAFTISVEVKKVKDGDTLAIIDKQDLGKFNVRLANIDAPQYSRPKGKIHQQPFGREAKQFIQLNIKKAKEVKLRVTGVDPFYGRLIAIVIVIDQKNNQININEQLVKNGLAWWYKDFSNEFQYWKFQKKAQQKKIGIWSQQNPQPPWEYRKEIKQKEKQK